MCGDLERVQMFTSVEGFRDLERVQFFTSVEGFRIVLGTFVNKHREKFGAVLLILRRCRCPFNCQVGLEIIATSFRELD